MPTNAEICLICAKPLSSGSILYGVTPKPVHASCFFPVPLQGVKPPTEEDHDG